MVRKEQIIYSKVEAPTTKAACIPVDLTDATMVLHKEKIMQRMREENLDAVLVYGDREHGTNFGYLTGFEPRFEEALLILHHTGKAYLLLGNESLRMAQYSRIPAEAIHVPYFSLPNQPMEHTKTLAGLLGDAKVEKGMKCGIAGWKMFTSKLENNSQLYDVPYFIVHAVKEAIGEEGILVNACTLFIHPERGARIIMNANEIAHYEFGASLASSCILEMLNEIEVGKTELELASKLAAYGQPVNVQTICATGDRFTNAIVAPRNKKLQLGDMFTSTLGFRGGLTCRSGYIAAGKEDLNPEVADYVESVAKPYYAAAATWYETLGIGVTGGEIYDAIESVIPKQEYGWELNPGHFTAGEEWMSSPIYLNSDIEIKSGMMLQMDIIPKIQGYGGANAEDGVAVADEVLRAEIKGNYPEVWTRIEARRKYMMDILGICLKPEILPLSNTEGYLRPLLLNKEYALRVNR